MSTNIIQKIALSAVLISSASFAFAGGVTKHYIYGGDESARSVCMAIAKDQVDRLERVLKNNRVSKFDKKAHTRFACNNENLLSFAQQMQAEKSMNYLDRLNGQPHKQPLLSER